MGLLLTAIFTLSLIFYFLVIPRFLNQPDKKLHLGCGSKIFEGWINIDMNPKGDFTLDLREGLPFADNSVELIYTEHSLEHFYR